MPLLLSIIIPFKILRFASNKKKKRKNGTRKVYYLRNFQNQTFCFISYKKSSVRKLSLKLKLLALSCRSIFLLRPCQNQRNLRILTGKKHPQIKLVTLFFLTLASDIAVLYENDASSILVLSTKKGYCTFLKRAFVFQKICFKGKVLKTFKISTDCHVNTC